MCGRRNLETQLLEPLEFASIQVDLDFLASFIVLEQRLPIDPIHSHASHGSKFQHERPEFVDRRRDLDCYPPAFCCLRILVLFLRIIRRRSRHVCHHRWEMTTPNPDISAFGLIDVLVPRFPFTSSPLVFILHPCAQSHFRDRPVKTARV